MAFKIGDIVMRLDGDKRPQENIKEYNEWLICLRNRYLPQPKQEWSEEDEKEIDSIIETIRIRKFKHPQLAPVYDVDINWLKSLKVRYRRE